MPGDSPMGYRLPLDSLPWASRADYPYLVERDPFAPRDALPDAAAIRARYAGRPMRRATCPACIARRPRRP